MLWITINQVLTQPQLDLSRPLFALVLPRQLARLAPPSLRIVRAFPPLVCIWLQLLAADLEEICNIAIQILEQKAFCQQDPDQDDEDEAPEDQAEYDSVLISSAGDLVAALANGLGADFGPAFNTFFPLIAKYYVRSLNRKSIAL